jgi:hypothetical protein
MTVLSIEISEKDEKSGAAERENPGECEKDLYTVFTEFFSILSHFPGSVAFLPGLHGRSRLRRSRLGRSGLGRSGLSRCTDRGTLVC